MENKEIPKLNFRSPIIPESIKEIIYKKNGDVIFNTNLTKEEQNAFVDGVLFNRFNNAKNLDENKKSLLIKEYIEGFRKGYFEFEYVSDFQIVSTVLGETFPFVVNSMYSTETKIENGNRNEEIKTYNIAFENGKKYKALETVLDNPLKFDTLFSSALSNFKENKSETKLSVPEIKFNISQTELMELIKALIENGNVIGLQKNIVIEFSKFFNLEIKNPDKIIQDIKNRNNNSETLFLDKLKTSFLNFIQKKNTRK